MDLIELHILQSFPVTCLNRDDVGAPKSAFFGGVQRARVSSQSWKRAIREMAREAEPNLFAGTRTRFVVKDLDTRLRAAGCTEPEAWCLAETTAAALGKLDTKKGKVKTLLYFSPEEMQSVVRELREEEVTAPLKKSMESAATLERAKNTDKAATAQKAHDAAQKALAKLCEKAAKRLKDEVKDAADIALFGRMVADDKSLTVEGAALFSHALSTHQSASEIDFFSAVDDSPKEDDGSDDDDEGAGAGHIGTLEFSSACYYRYVGINLGMLKGESHLAHLSGDEFRQILETFLRSAVLAVPGARKNSMFGFNPPAYVIGLRRKKGHPLSLANAFEKPVRVRGDGYIAPSIQALEDHLTRLRASYGLKAEGDVEKKVPPATLDECITDLVVA